MKRSAINVLERIAYTDGEEGEKLKEIRKQLSNIAHLLRCNDRFFDLDWEDRIFYNKVGKVIGKIVEMLIEYEYDNEEEKKELRRKMGKIESCIERGENK